MGSAKDSGHSEISRRELLGRVGSGLLVLTVSTPWGELTPPKLGRKAPRSKTSLLRKVLYWKSWERCCCPARARPEWRITLTTS